VVEWKANQEGLIVFILTCINLNHYIADCRFIGAPQYKVV
jgi:hypothetical protein